MRVKRIVSAIFIMAMVMVAVWPSGALAGKDNIQLALSDVLVGLDYYQTTARVNIQVGYMMFDPLLERDAKTGELRPHLVTSWKVVNPTTWEFKLRTDVKFHNGNPFNAESVRFTVMERILDPAQQSPQRSGFKWIKDVEVIDNNTFRIITEKPYPLVLQRMNVLFPYDPQWIKEMEAKHGKAYLASHAMGTGPFKLVKFVSRDRIELVRNDDYWKKGVPAFPKMTIRTIPEASTRLAELIKGNIDDGVIVPDMAPAVKKNKNLYVMETPILRVVHFQFDSIGRAPKSPKALQDPRVRRAFWHAIDRKTILKHVLARATSYLNIPINPMAFGADKDMPAPEYDPEKAVALMKEAGSEGYTATVWVFNTMLVKFVEASMPYLEKINVKLKIRDYVGRYGEFAKVWKGGKCDGITGVSWGSYNIFDADALWSYFFMIPEAPYNYTKDTELSDWLHAARETLDPEKRKELYRKAQKRIIDQAYWMPIWTQHALHAVNKHFQFEFGSDQVPRWQYGKWVD